MIIELTVLASIYWNDKYVSTGHRFNKHGITVASRELPLGSCILATHKGNEARVLINDRGPCASKTCQHKTPNILKRKLDLSLGTAKKLKCSGLCYIKYRIVDKKACR